MTHLPTLGSTIAQMPTAQLAPILAQEARTFRIMSDASPDPEPFGEFPAEAIVPPRASPAAAPPQPLDETTIAASLVRMGAIGSHERPPLQPPDARLPADLRPTHLPATLLSLQLPLPHLQLAHPPQPP